VDFDKQLTTIESLWVVTFWSWGITNSFIVSFQLSKRVGLQRAHVEDNPPDVRFLLAGQPQAPHWFGVFFRKALFTFLDPNSVPPFRRDVSPLFNGLHIMLVYWHVVTFSFSLLCLQRQVSARWILQG